MTSKHQRIVVPAEIHSLAKIEAAKNRVTLQEWIIELILKEVKK